jgi:hypothetical protein
MCNSTLIFRWTFPLNTIVINLMGPEFMGLKGTLTTTLKGQKLISKRRGVLSIFFYLESTTVPKMLGTAWVLFPS